MSPAGRPRGFDADVALDRAMDVFWAQGYDGASIADLSAAMGVNRPSMYAAYGNKEDLFGRALDRYAAGPAAYSHDALREANARDVARAWLHGAIAATTAEGRPHGCLTVQGALATSADAATVRDDLAAFRIAGEQRLRERFEAAHAAGDLPRHADPVVLARFIATVANGIAVQASGGATAEQLRAIVEPALLAIPEN